MEKITFEQWEKENEDKIVENYLFDLNEMMKGEHYDTIKSIQGYWDYAESIFNNLTDKERKDY